MSRYAIKEGLLVVKGPENLRIVLDETGRRQFDSPLVAAVLDRITGGETDEDALVAALADRHAAAEVYYALLTLEKKRILVAADRQPEPPAVLFREQVLGKTEDRTAPPARLPVRIVAVGGMEQAAADCAASLARLQTVQVLPTPDWRQSPHEPDAIFVVLTGSYLAPELAEFGRYAQAAGLRWLAFKPYGVAAWLGPLFLPQQTGCSDCLLDRLAKHREDELAAACCLSRGYSEYSVEAVTGLLAVELEKLAAGQTSALTGTLFVLDFKTLQLERHALARRPQCPLCGSAAPVNPALAALLAQPPLQLQSRPKADYQDGGERVCSAVETFEKYAHLVSPLTGVIGRIAVNEDVPACFGHVMSSDWIVRRKDQWLERDNARMKPIGVSAGKGRTAAQARVSALGEAIERYSSQYEGHETIYRASFEQLGDVAVAPNAIMGYSEAQYRDRQSWCDRCVTAVVPEPYDPARSIDWTSAWSLSQQRWRLIPSALAYYAYPQEGGGDVCFGCSNGVAAGNCLEEAIMQGLYELVERDATAMWWYHRLKKPAVDWRSFASPFAATAFAQLKRMGYTLDILDLTNDLAIPTFCATLFDQENRLQTLGLGSHMEPRIALERAISELGQGWGKLNDLDALACKVQNAPISQADFLRSDPAQPARRLTDFATVHYADFAADIAAMVQLLRQRDLELLVLDLTRPDVGLSVARVIVPGLSHFWPRFGCRRLYDVPKAAGWIAGDVTEQNLNPVPIPW